ncbi:GntR family transcriptional regulator [Flavobacterium granuli]|uniref:GntR family transcriptional regulator n=1 Tax=Flavobacterium granuli TaxID=280093 RepID=UPI000A0494F5
MFYYTKYQQLVSAVLNTIKHGVLKKGDVMPSINELSFEYEISRITIGKGICLFLNNR